MRRAEYPLEPSHIAMFSGLKKLFVSRKLSFPPQLSEIWNPELQERINLLNQDLADFFLQGTDEAGALHARFRPSRGSLEEYKAAIILGAVSHTLFQYDSPEALDGHLQSVSVSYMALGSKGTQGDFSDMGAYLTTSQLYVKEFWSWYTKLCRDAGCEDTIVERHAVKELVEGGPTEDGFNNGMICLLKDLVRDDGRWIKGREGKYPSTVAAAAMARLAEARYRRMKRRLDRLSGLEGSVVGDESEESTRSES